MIKLQISEKSKEKHKEYWKKFILPNLKNAIKETNITINQKTHKNFIQRCIDDFEILATGSPEKLRNFQDNVGAIFENNEKYRYYLLKLFGYQKFVGKAYTSDEIINYDNYDKIKTTFKKHWSPYHFVLSEKLRVCPYCNRQYITPLYKDSNNGNIKVRADLDHFFPKKQYPYFSMSLYNLVPSCKFCNSSFKGTKEFNIDDIHPYEENFGDYFKFYLDTIKEKGKLKITVEKEDNSRMNNYFEIFPIEDLYQYHENQAFELVDKRIIYSDSYINELYEKNKDIFCSEEHIKSLIIGYIPDKKNLNDEVLGKFRRDICQQLGFVAPKEADKDIINKLKEIRVKLINKT